MLHKPIITNAMQQGHWADLHSYLLLLDALDVALQAGNCLHAACMQPLGLLCPPLLLPHLHTAQR